MTRPDHELAVDTSTPSIARCYDAMLGGKDNFEVDREACRHALRIAPELAQLARDNREWLSRVVSWLVRSAGIDQFLDCGSGLPTAENTHQTAQRVNPDATVVYVDNDPSVIAHSRALLVDNGRTHVVEADLTQPDRILQHPTVLGAFDFTRPIALFQVSTLHHVGPEHRPHELAARYLRALPAGSYLALSHFHDPGPADQETSEIAGRLQREIFAAGTMGHGWFRSRTEITDFFAGLDLVDPGVTSLHEWWPPGPRLAPASAEQRMCLAGLGRKP